MAYNQYDEGIASRSAQHRGGAVGGNIANGALPANSNTAGGGNQVVETSSKIDGVSQFTEKRSTSNSPDDTNSYVSLASSTTATTLTLGKKQAFLGNAGQTIGMNSSFGGPDITR